MNGRTTTYMLGVLLVLLMGIGGVVMVLRFVPESQVPIALTTIGGMVVPTLAAILGFLHSVESAKKQDSDIVEVSKKLDQTNRGVDHVEVLVNGHTRALETKIDTLRDERDVSRHDVHKLVEAVDPAAKLAAAAEVLKAATSPSPPAV